MLHMLRRRLFSPLLCHIRNACHTVKESRKEAPGKFMQIGQNNVHYEIEGHGKNYLFLIPGGMGNARNVYTNVMSDLDKEKFTLIGWDPPGFGFTGPPNYLDSIDAPWKDAEVASQLIKALGIKKLSVMGWSVGGFTAIITAARNPDVMNKLILVATFSQVNEEVLKSMEDNREISKWIPLIRDPIVEMHGLDYCQQCIDKYLKLFRARLLLQNQGTYVAEIEKIKCPTLIVHAINDSFIPFKYGLELSKIIQNSRFVQFEKGNHFPHLDNPQLFNKLIKDFLTDTVHHNQ